MGDILCRRCAEPWDSYGVHQRMDMDEEEAQRFLRGEGCPSCHFGTKCPSCNGKGKERCETCLGFGHVPTHTHGLPCDQCPPTHDIVPWSQRVESCPAPKRKVCPSCNGERTTKEPCRACNGTGKPTGGDFDQFLLTLIESSDEDPLELIQNVIIDGE